jgi:hypothetical protein
MANSKGRSISISNPGLVRGSFCEMLYCSFSADAGSGTAMSIILIGQPLKAKIIRY